ncbi:hypothetical protein NQ315_014377 [Exocentrus adspersus]|uniref:Uncharacterized protein n=1 Tax=Exocentrus adspersus TaxID=1586481 RepID=A0AAV8V6D1_9CUCU|nr:hypothetical protein NQ315_014377 [Exocentrus adspersus]
MDQMDVDLDAEAAYAALLPQKSKGRYERSFKDLKVWCRRMAGDETVTENCMLAYVVEKSKTLKSPASLWSEYSMLKSMLSIEDNVDISKFLKLKAFLKRKNDDYKPKKFKVFTREDMETFLKEADDRSFLLMKVAMIVGAWRISRTWEM